MFWIFYLSDCFLLDRDYCAADNQEKKEESMKVIWFPKDNGNKRNFFLNVRSKHNSFLMFKPFYYQKNKEEVRIWRIK